jgi:hypothetical protein
LVVAGIWFYSQWVLLILASIYVSHGLILKLLGLLNRFRKPLVNGEDAGNLQV